MNTKRTLILLAELEQERSDHERAAAECRRLQRQAMAKPVVDFWTVAELLGEAEAFERKAQEIEDRMTGLRAQVGMWEP